MKNLPVKIVSIDDEVIIDVFAETITRQILKPYFIDILKKLDLFYKDAWFQFEYTSIDNGLQIKILPYEPTNLKSDYYDELVKNWKEKIK